MVLDEAQLRFAAELALALVAIAGAGLALARPGLLVLRRAAAALAAAGFAAIGAAAMARGAAVLVDPASGELAAARLAGLAALATAAAWWRPGGGRRILAWAGVAGVAAAEVLSLIDRAALAEGCRFGGALSLGAALLASSRRTISARIAAASTAIVLGVVVATSLALSAVVGRNVEDEAIRRLSARAATEARAVEEQGVAQLQPASLLAEALGNNEAARDALATLLDPATPAELEAAARTSLMQRVGGFIARVGGPAEVGYGPTLLTGPEGRVAISLQADPVTATELAGSGVMRRALEAGQPVQTVAVIAGRPMAIAAAAIEAPGAAPLGGVLTAADLGRTFLQRRAELLEGEEPGAGLALADRSGALAAVGPTVPEAAAEVVASALDGAAPGDGAPGAAGGTTGSAGGRFLIARPVLDADGAPVMAIVLSVPSAQLEDTRAALYRVLFAVAVAAGLGALALAAVAGERIGGGLRRLTATADALRAGNLDASAGLAADDELGRLGASFDSMAASLRSMTADLRRAAEDEARLRARLEAVVAGMGEALLAVDGQGRITDVNAAAEELCDTPARELRGRRVDEVVRLVDAGGEDLSARLSRPVLESWTAPGVLVQPNGREVPVVTSAGTLRGPGNEVAGAVFVLRDVRREREVERMKTEFLANISHELRTPLTPIKGFASLLRSRDLPPAKARGFAEEIHVAADQMERVVGQLVNFATIEAGRLDLAPVPLPAGRLVEDALARWRARLDGSHRITRRVARGLPPLLGDPAYLGQALDELIDNALKYSPGGGTVRLTAALAARDGERRVAIAVADEGVGVATDRLGTIFEDFAQADASATRRFGGLGLGLALVQRIVRAHGGDLLCDSVPGKGSRFTLLLPMVPEG